MMVYSKICGLRTPEALVAAVEGGVRFLGFVFYPPSPRHVDVDIAQELSFMVPTGVRSVGLFVDPSDEVLETVLGRVQLDMIQLHGGESVSRVGEIKARYVMPVIKAFPVSCTDDLKDIEDYRDVADWYLFDAKPAVDGLPGGSGEVFDWNLLSGKSFSKPWMLSGGLNADNVGGALLVLRPDAVDVSSGVERMRGDKDVGKIKAFLEAVKAV